MPKVLRVAALLLATLPALAASDVTVLYDAEFGGYVPVVGGIERPDLASAGTAGRVPESARAALRRAKKAWRREQRAAARDSRPRIEAPEPVRPSAGVQITTPRDPAAQARRPSRRWLRRTAVTTVLLVLDGSGRPVEGARVYRYYDPTFYPVNQDASGARLFDAWRLMPRPFPGATAAALASVHDAYWGQLSFAPVAEITPTIDADHNPWIRAPLPPVPPVEYIGRTGPGGSLEIVSGLFNLRDPRRFPRAIVPEGMKIGFVVVADGYQAEFSEKRFREGGTSESRSVRLLESADNPVMRSDELILADRALGALPLAKATVASLEADVAQQVDRMTFALVEVPEPQREAVRSALETRFWLSLARRAPAALQVPLVRRALTATPRDLPAVHWIASLLAGTRGVWAGQPPPKKPIPHDEVLVEAEALLDGLIAAEPRFLPAYPLLDVLLARRGASDAERRRRVARLFKESPFDPWARARLATFDLRAGRAAEAFDHLRFTYMAVPGLGGDRELALALSAHYWKIGLPEKSGAYAWLLTGRVPEDPFTPPKTAKEPAAPARTDGTEGAAGGAAGRPAGNGATDR